MATKPTSSPIAASGAYVILDSYYKIAVPVEALTALADVLLLERKYEDGRNYYELQPEQQLSLTLLPAHEVTALRVAKKLTD